MMNATAAAHLDFDVQKETRAAELPGRRPTVSMRKIFVLVAVAIAIFMAFTFYSVQKEIQGSAQLAAIKDMYFPLLQRLDANIVRLDKIQELYLQVVLTGDQDTIVKAGNLGTQADQTFGEIAALYPGHDASIGQLRADLLRYQALATKTSIAFLNKDRETAAPMAASMNRALADIESRLKAFRLAGYTDFVDTLARSQRGAELRLLMGIALGVMNLLFMAVLVYFIRNNMKMMSIIAVQNATLEQRVTERTAQLSQKTSDINAMLQNMRLGVSTVVPGNRIHPEYSNHLCTIFSIDDFAGKDLIESLFSSSTLGVDTKDQIAVALGAILGEDAMMFALNGHLLPQEMHLQAADGVRKIVNMEWSPIVNERGTVDKVLLITQDVTHLRELEVSAAQQKEELDIIAKIIKISVGKLNTFFETTRAFIGANRKLIDGSAARDEGLISALFRNMHTIKGNARMFEFSHITDAAHLAEQTYDRLRRGEGLADDSTALLVELDAVATAVERYLHVNEEKLGRTGRALDLVTARGIFVGNEQLAELRDLIATQAAAHPEAGLDALQQRIDQLGLISLRRIVSGVADSLCSLAKEIGKPAPAVEVVNGDIAFNAQFAEALKNSLMHINRNAMDHGIETPAERVAAGKPEQGTIRLRCETRGDHLVIHIGDDGRGLGLPKLYQMGVAKGSFGATESPTRGAVADLIFRAGLSTAKHVTQVSGRGVGMDAVRMFLKEQGATICIELQDPHGTDLAFAPFEFAISVPHTARCNSGGAREA